MRRKREILRELDRLDAAFPSPRPALEVVKVYDNEKPPPPREGQPRLIVRVIRTERDGSTFSAIHNGNGNGARAAELSAEILRLEAELDLLDEIGDEGDDTDE